MEKYKNEIMKAVEFQEKFFDYRVERI